MKKKQLLLISMLTLFFTCFLLGESSYKQLLGPKVRYGGIVFRYYFPNVTSVRIAGDFNNWMPNIKLTRTSKAGVFQGFVPILLKKNKYRYRLIVDGIWQKDPANSLWEYDKTGNRISFFYVKNRLITYGPNPEKTAINQYKFYYKNSTATAVYLVGSFNNFNPFEHKMKRDRNGIWTTTAQIFPGKHHYCFIVDGTWITDPTRVKIAYNRFGRSFSIFTAR